MLQELQHLSETAETRARALVEKLDDLSISIVEGEGGPEAEEAVLELLRTLTCLDRNVAPEIPLYPAEIAELQLKGVLSREEVLAVTIAQVWTERISEISGRESFNTTPVRWFFEHLSGALQGVLHPDGFCAREPHGALGHLGMAVQHYYELLAWTQNRITQPTPQRNT